MSERSDSTKLSTPTNSMPPKSTFTSGFFRLLAVNSIFLKWRTRNVSGAIRFRSNFCSRHATSNDGSLPAPAADISTAITSPPPDNTSKIGSLAGQLLMSGFHSNLIRISLSASSVSAIWSAIAITSAACSSPPLTFVSSCSSCVFANPTSSGTLAVARGGCSALAAVTSALNAFLNASRFAPLSGSPSSAPSAVTTLPAAVATALSWLASPETWPCSVVRWPSIRLASSIRPCAVDMLSDTNRGSFERSPRPTKLRISVILIQPKSFGSMSPRSLKKSAGSRPSFAILSIVPPTGPSLRERPEIAMFGASMPPERSPWELKFTWFEPAVISSRNTSPGFLFAPLGLNPPFRKTAGNFTSVAF